MIFKMKKSDFSVFSVIFISLTVFLIIFSLFVIVRGGPVFIFGRASVELLSGSMAPTYNVGDVITIEKTDASEIKAGDVICFKSADPAISGYLNTHRVVDISADSDGNPVFTTKGDANAEVDAYTVSADALVGRVVAANGLFSKLLLLLKSKWGFFTVILIPLFAVLALSVRQFAASVKEAVLEEDGNDEEHSKAKEDLR